MGDAPLRNAEWSNLGDFKDSKRKLIHFESTLQLFYRAFSAKGSRFAGVGPATSFMLIAFHSPACLIFATSLYLYGTVCWNTRIVPVLHSSLENGDNLKRLLWILLHYCRTRCTIVTTKRYAIMPKSAKYAWPTKICRFFFWFFSEDPRLEKIGHHTTHRATDLDRLNVEGGGETGISCRLV